MSLIHPLSSEISKSELDLFSIPPTQSVVEFGYYVEHKPVTSIDSSNTIEFFIPANDDFIDLSATKLQVKAKIIQSDGKAIVSGDDGKLIPLCYLLNTMFNQVDIYLGSTLVSSSTNNYSYRAYLDALLYYNSDAKKTFLQSALFDNASTSGTTYSVENGKLLNQSRLFQVFGHLHADIFAQEKLMINQLPITIRLSKAKDSFSINGVQGFAASNPKLVISYASLFIRKVRILSEAQEAISAALQLSPAKYFITKTDVKHYNIPTGTSSQNFENIFMGQLPRRFIVAFVDSKAYNGDYVKNPFNFTHANIRQIVSYVNGTMVPSTPYKPDFENSNYQREYYSLFTELNQDNNNAISNLTYSMFGDGFTLFAFSLSPDNSDGSESGHLSLIKRGVIRLDVDFSSTLTSSLTMIIYAHSDSVIQIDKDRNVQIDY